MALTARKGMDARILAGGFALLLYGAAAITANAPGAAAGEASRAGLSPAAKADVIAAKRSALPQLVVHDTPRPALESGFQDAQGQSMSLARFRGKVVFLNFWATWCPPCREEMPSIDRLAGITKNDGIAVVALSTDRGGRDPVRRFYDKIGIKNLPIYVDRRGKMPREAAILGLPVTVILDREGREVARLTGHTEWDRPELVAMLRRIADDTKSGSGPKRMTVPSKS